MSVKMGRKLMYHTGNHMIYTAEAIMMPAKKRHFIILDIVIQWLYLKKLTLKLSR